MGEDFGMDDIRQLQFLQRRGDLCLPHDGVCGDCYTEWENLIETPRCQTASTRYLWWEPLLWRRVLSVVDASNWSHYTGKYSAE